jgi:chromosome partitioning protein
MKVIAVAQQKGGVMKSTLAIHIAAEAVRRGVKAVVLELDKQGTASLWSERRATVGSAHDLLKPVERTKRPPDVIKTESAALMQLLQALSGLGVQMAVLDMPGAHNASVGPAIKAADLVLIPTRPQEVDISASAETLATVQRLRKPYAYVITFVEGKGDRAEEALLALEAEGHPVAKQFIWRRNVYSDAIGAGETVLEREPKGKAADEIKSLYRWIEKQLEGQSDDRKAHERDAVSGKQPAQTRH